VDSESGLVYLRARYYDPKTGRFLSPDPHPGSAGEPASQHAYTYAQNNPVRYTDPTGRSVYDNPLPSPDPDSPIARVRRYGPMDPDECARFAPDPRRCDALFNAAGPCDNISNCGTPPASNPGRCFTGASFNYHFYNHGLGVTINFSGYTRCTVKVRYLSISVTLMLTHALVHLPKAPRIHPVTIVMLLKGLAAFRSAHWA